jgi:hypothetical protein
VVSGQWKPLPAIELVGGDQYPLWKRFAGLEQLCTFPGWDSAHDWFRDHGFEPRTVDGCDLDWCGIGGGWARRCGGLLDAAGGAADEGICVAEDVSGVRVDYAAGEFGLPGVWEGDCGWTVVFLVVMLGWGSASWVTLSGWRSQAGAHRLFWGRSLTRLKCAEFRDDGLQRGFRVRIMARMNAGNFGC